MLDLFDMCRVSCPEVYYTDYADLFLKYPRRLTREG